MRRTLGLVLLGLPLVASTTTARAQFGFALDPPGASPGLRAGGFGYSGFGYSAMGPRGFGYYVGLPDYTANNGPSGAYSPIFNAMAAAPRDNVQLGPTYGGYEYTISRFGNRSAGGSAVPMPTPYGFTRPPANGGSVGYRSAYVPPASAGGARWNPGSGPISGYGEPTTRPRGILGTIFGRR